MTGVAILIATVILTVTAAIADRDRQTLVTTGIAAAIVWLLYLSSLPPLAASLQRSPLAGIYAFLIISGLRILLCLILAIVAILAFDLSHYAVLLTLAAMYLPLLGIEVLLVVHSIHKKNNPSLPLNSATEVCA